MLWDIPIVNCFPFNQCWNVHWRTHSCQRKTGTWVHIPSAHLQCSLALLHPRAVEVWFPIYKTTCSLTQPAGWLQEAAKLQLDTQNAVTHCLLTLNIFCEGCFTLYELFWGFFRWLIALVNFFPTSVSLFRQYFSSFGIKILSVLPHNTNARRKCIMKATQSNMTESECDIERVISLLTCEWQITVTSFSTPVHQAAYSIWLLWSKRSLPSRVNLCSCLKTTFSLVIYFSIRKVYN